MDRRCSGWWVVDRRHSVAIDEVLLAPPPRCLAWVIVSADSRCRRRRDALWRSVRRRSVSPWMTCRSPRRLSRGSRRPICGCRGLSSPRFGRLPSGSATRRTGAVATTGTRRRGDYFRVARHGDRPKPGQAAGMASWLGERRHGKPVGDPPVPGRLWSYLLAAAGTDQVLRLDEPPAPLVVGAVGALGQDRVLWLVDAHGRPLTTAPASRSNGPCWPTTTDPLESII